MSIISVTNLYNNHQEGGSSLTVTPTDAQVKGSNLILCINCDPAITISSITDTSGNTYTRVSPNTINSDYAQTMWLASGIKAAGASANTITITFSGATAGSSVACYLVAGSPLNATGSAAASGTGTSASTGNITTRIPATILVAMSGFDHTATGGTAGWTVSANDFYQDITQYLIKTNSLTTVNPTLTQNLSGPWVVTCVAFAAPQAMFMGRAA